MKIWLKGLWLNLIFTSVVYIDMYQDIADANKTVVIVETSKGIKTLTVDNKELDTEKVIEKIEELANER